jgi:hypothetical protein
MVRWSGEHRQGIEVGGAAAAAASPLQRGAAGVAPILDIPTPDCGQSPRLGLNPVSRRIFSRALMGVKKPARYYFLTVTSSPVEPLERRHWDALRQHLRRLLPRTVHFHVITKEGFGVIHIILRLGRGEKRLEIRPFREWWRSYHKAIQVKIIRVNNRDELCKYIADQRHKHALAGEFAWQDDIVSWGYSKGWLPKGFCKHFGRFWFHSRDADLGQREMFLHDWLLRSFNDPQQIKIPPQIKSGRGLQ